LHRGAVDVTGSLASDAVQCSGLSSPLVTVRAIEAHEPADRRGWSLERETDSERDEIAERITRENGSAPWFTRAG